MYILQKVLYIVDLIEIPETNLSVIITDLKLIQR